MHKDKFLTVYAVFDGITQATLKKWQHTIIRNGLCGRQSMDIPFHISLGSFAPNRADELIERIRRITSEFSAFELKLTSVKTFGKSVLYLEPSESDEIAELHKLFDGNYADGLPFIPHSTVFIGDDSKVLSAKQILSSVFTPVNATVTQVHLSEFFPTRNLLRQSLRKN